MKLTGIDNEAIFSFYQTSMALCRKFIKLTLIYYRNGLQVEILSHQTVILR